MSEAGAPVPSIEDARVEPLFIFLYVIAAILVACFMMSPYAAANGDHFVMVAKSILHPALLQDPLVLADSRASYAAGLWLAAYPASWISRYGHVPVPTVAACLVVFLWALIGVAYFRFVLAATGNKESAGFALVLFAIGMPFLVADTASSMPGLDRSIAMPALFWGMERMLRGRRAAAWTCLIAATYLHPNPAIYLWPVFFVEELLAMRDPSARRGAALRSGLVAVAAAPILFASVAKLPGQPWYDDLLRCDILTSNDRIAGMGMSLRDYTVMAEGAVLFVFFFVRSRSMPAFQRMLPYVALGALIPLLGKAAYSAYMNGWGQWISIMRYMPWDGLFLLEIVWQITFSYWLATERRANAPAWLVLFYLMSITLSYDAVARLGALVIAACMILSRRRASLAVAAAFGCFPLAYRLFPAPFHAAGSMMGLHGGLYTVPSFHLRTSVAVFFCIAFGVWLERTKLQRPPRFALAAGAAMLLALFSASQQGQWIWPAPVSPVDKLGEWLRKNSPEEAVILPTPIGSIDHTYFVATTERSLFASDILLGGPLQYGLGSPFMQERLHLLGLSCAGATTSDEVYERVLGLDSALTPEKIESIRKRFRIDYVLTPKERPLFGELVYRGEGLFLYQLPSPRLSAAP